MLAVLGAGRRYGYELLTVLKELTGGVPEIKEGTLYPLLHRLEDAGYIASEWGTSENNRRAKFYRLTALGKKQLQLETESWQRFADAVSLVLRYA